MKIQKFANSMIYYIKKYINAALFFVVFIVINKFKKIECVKNMVNNKTYRMTLRY